MTQTREQIEDDIVAIETARLGLGPRVTGALNRAADRLRADLARLDGPAPGNLRVYVSFEGRESGRTESADQVDAYVFSSLDDAQRAADPWTLAVASFDIPLPVVPVVEGQVVP